MNSKNRNFWLTIAGQLLLAFSLVSNSFSQETYDSLYSEILEEQRSLHIILPDGYDESSEVKYDVVYVLDGEWNTEFTAEMQKHIVRWRFMPENIIVGI